MSSSSSLMADTDGSGIETVAPPAVKSLRSKFEQLSHLSTDPSPPPPHSSLHPNPNRFSHSSFTSIASSSGGGGGASGSMFLHPDSTSARPRALSNPQLDPLAIEHDEGHTGGTNSPLQALQSLRPVQHLRNASSSSDLKRKPPPPPVPKRLSPSASPALRPVSPSPSLRAVSPSPSVVMDASGRSPAVRQVPLLDLDEPHGDEERGASAGSVASLVNKFVSSSPSPISEASGSPARKSRSPLPPATHAMTPSPPTIPPRPKPAPPPRPPRRSFPPTLSSPASGTTSLPDSSSPSPLIALKSLSPFNDSSDSETIFASSPAETHSSPPHSHPSPPTRSSSQQSSYSSLDNASTSSSRFSQFSNISLSSTSATDESSSSYASHPPPAPHLSRPVPPRPPPRHGSSKPSLSSIGSNDSPHLGASAFTTASITHIPPPLPSRRATAPPDEHPAPIASSPEKKSAAQRLPPPPTRTIGLNDKLPPPRRAPAAADDASSDDSEAEQQPLEDPKARLMESMPDTSRASRRPPDLSAVHPFSSRDVVVPAYQGGLLNAGHVFVVATQKHVKVYDLAQSEGPMWALDGRDFMLPGKELRVTAMEWRSGGGEGASKGRYAWLGTKEGHLFELDVRLGAVTGQRPLAHAGAVTHIIRHGDRMVSLDDVGKLLVFAPANDTDEGLALTYRQPRVIRIAEHQVFARVFAGRLWTSAREPPGASRGPIVRVYDVLSGAGNAAVGRSVLPTEHLGAVTCGTVVPSDPTRVYLGHEGGVISIWTTSTDESDLPACVEVVKVGVSDVLTMEGVHDRLWIGGRKGTLAAYDVAPRPWVLKMGWTAHGGLPVTRLAVDVLGMETLGRCVVVSVGRDERVGIWDGMLGLDWIETELLKQESRFSSFRDMKVLIATWNLDAARPEHLIGTPPNVSFLTDVLRSVDSPDIIAFGFQEMIDLESRKMAAKTVLLGGKKNGGGSGGINGGGLSAGIGGGSEISEKVTRAYKRWFDRLVTAVRLAMPPECPYTVIHTENLVGLFTCIFVKNSERANLRDIAVTTVKRGMGGRYGNKGAIVARLVVDDSSVCFINCHLAAGQHHVRQRNADVAGILEQNAVFDECEAVTQDSIAYVGGGDGSMVLDHEIVFMNGDMNYRIEQRRDVVISAAQAGEYHTLLVHDQLLKEMKFNRNFRLRTFREGALAFAPTYKYDRRTDEYDSSEKRRTPAWCDRVLWRSREEDRVALLSYRRYEANVSDHRPVSAAFRIRVKSVRLDERARTKGDVQGAWRAREQELVRGLVEFYVQRKALA